jgi:SAM-dependent methyltransferase
MISNMTYQTPIDSRFANYLEEYLKAYWLRPVTALVRTLEALELGLDKYPAKGSIELACGDGVNSFIARGGKVPYEFDVFKSLSLPSAEAFFNAKLDVYDDVDDELYRGIKFDKNVLWETGIDAKQALLDKAKVLNTHQNLICHDLNNPLEIADDTYSFVFSNSIYWVQERRQLIDEIYRVMKAGSIAKFVIVNDSFIDGMAWTKLKPFQFSSLLDMGRHTHYKSILGKEIWEDEFAASGFSVKKITPMFSDILVHMIELHDLREISPLTSAMAKSLTIDKMIYIKKHWIEYFVYLFSAMYRDGYFDLTNGRANYHIFELEKNV